VVAAVGGPGAAPAREKYGLDTVLIVDGTLVPTGDRTVAASSENCRTSANMQVLLNAESRLVVAVGQPQPGNRKDCTAWTDSKINRAASGATVLAAGGYQGTGHAPTPRERARRRSIWQHCDFNIALIMKRELLASVHDFGIAD
jgi:hypothetical protein